MSEKWEGEKSSHNLTSIAWSNKAGEGLFRAVWSIGLIVHNSGLSP